MAAIWPSTNGDIRPARSSLARSSAQQCASSLDPDAAGAALAWARCLSEWNLANHVRTPSGVLSAALLTLACAPR